MIAHNHLNLGHGFLTALRGKLSIEAADNGLPAGVTPEDIFHYAYGVFHSPGYRSRYAEFLKIDFPRLPWTGNLELFRALARLGGELVSLHLLEFEQKETKETKSSLPSFASVPGSEASPRVYPTLTTFVREGVNAGPVVEKVSHGKNTVWINKAQTSGFRGVPENVWNFHIGGYQVCEKWLKDRKGRTLSEEESPTTVKSSSLSPKRFG